MWQCSSGCLLLLPHCQLPIHHPLTQCVWVCACVWTRKKRRIRREEEERTSEATVQVPHPSFDWTKLEKQRKGRGERQQRDVFSEWFFLPFSSSNQWGKTVPAPFLQHSPEFLRFFDSRSFSFLPHYSLYRHGGGMGGGGGLETRQDRAFSLEIITFTLLMYGQTTKDIHRQWGRKWLCLCFLQ